MAKTSVLGSDLFDAELFQMYSVQKYPAGNPGSYVFWWETSTNNRVKPHFSWSDSNFYFDHGNASSGGRITGPEPAGFDDAWNIMSAVKRADNTASVYK